MDPALDLLVHHVACLLTLVPTLGEGALGRVDDGAVGFRAGRVAWVGPSSAAPDAREVVEGAGCVGLPGLVDCHTHALWAGSRAGEWSRRLAGESYLDIAQAGGGILSTVRATRQASDEVLAELLESRLRRSLEQGVTTVEVKTGYGLDAHHELRHLALLARGGWPVTVLPTLLAAHTVPPEWRHDPDGWVSVVVDDLIPGAVGHAHAVDVYCDAGAFTLAQAQRVLGAGRAAGLVGRVHAEQIAHTGITQVAASLGCASADHLERVDDAGIEAMARAGTVAVMLPGSMLTLRDVSPPVAAMREAGVAFAVGTDLNPGTSPFRDLWACATLAVLTMGLTPDEAVAGITREAARAAGVPDRGWLGPGAAGDLALFRPPPGDPPDVAALLATCGGHRAALVVREGRVVARAPRGGYN